MRSLGKTIAVGLCFLTCAACGTVKPTRAQTVAHMLAGAVRTYITTNEGRWPTDWDQLPSAVRDCNDSLRGSGMGHVQALYVFVPTNLPAMESREGRLILALYKGIKEDGLKGRYVVYQDPEKWVESCWISDYDFNEILASFGSGLPLPSEFGVSPRAQLRRIAPVGIMLFVVVFGLIGFRMILRRRSGNQSKNQPSVP